MSFVRMNITIPDHLARKLDRMVSQEKRVSSSLASLEERIKKMEREALRSNLEEGYKLKKG